MLDSTRRGDFIEISKVLRWLDRVKAEEIIPFVEEFRTWDIVSRQGMAY